MKYRLPILLSFFLTTTHAQVDDCLLTDEKFEYVIKDCFKQKGSKYKPGYEYVRSTSSGIVEYWTLIEWVPMPDMIPEGGRWKAKVSRDKIIWVDVWTDDIWIDQGRSCVHQPVLNNKPSNHNIHEIKGKGFIDLSKINSISYCHFQNNFDDKESNSFGYVEQLKREDQYYFTVYFDTKEVEYILPQKTEYTKLFTAWVDWVEFNN